MNCCLKLENLVINKRGNKKLDKKRKLNLEM